MNPHPFPRKPRVRPVPVVPELADALAEVARLRNRLRVLRVCEKRHCSLCLDCLEAAWGDDQPQAWGAASRHAERWPTR